MIIKQSSGSHSFKLLDVEAENHAAIDFDKKIYTESMRKFARVDMEPADLWNR